MTNISDNLHNGPDIFLNSLQYHKDYKFHLPGILEIYLIDIVSFI